MADNPYESCTACEEFSRNARKKAAAMDCPDLLEAIQRLMDTEKRGRSGTKGLVQRFRDYLGDDATHGPQLQDQQRSLRTYLDEYDNKDCGDPPSGAAELATRALQNPASTSIDDTGSAKAVAVTGGVLGLGYVAYRVVRFLPSLAPPLWWTIPENLAIP
jgi:hypothetical protein